MGNQEKKLQGLLQDRFAGYEADPGVDLWPAIESEIHPGKKRVVAWWPYAAVAASVIILLGALFLFRNEATTADQPNFANEETLPAQNPQLNAPEQEVQLAVEEEAPLSESPSEAELAPAIPVAKQKESLVENTPDTQPVDKKTVQRAVRVIPEKSLSAENMIAEVSPATRPEKVLSSKLRPIKGSFSRIESTVQTEKQPISQAATVSIRPPVPAPQKVEGDRNALNLNKLSLEKAVAFASEEISKWTNGSRRSRSRKSGDGETAKSRFAFAGLKVTRTRHNKDLNK